MSNHRLKVGVAHPYLGRGGSESRVMWAIEALKADYDVSVITTGGGDLDALNQFYGTSVKPDEVTFRESGIPAVLRRTGDALRGSLHQRHCRRVASEYDVLISAYNLCDFGVPAIHCIADFCWDAEIRRRLHPVPTGGRGFAHRDGILRRAYLGLARALSRPSGRDLFAGEDLILANSRWSAEIIRQKYGATVDVLYPPVLGEFPDVPSGERELGFVCLGRIAPEKRIERIVEILQRVRSMGHDVHLHVIGNAADSTYGAEIRSLSDGQEWVSLEGCLYGAEKAELLSRHRFGIHACQGEAFGIAVAEMVKAGCITFVPNEGGQAEIVDDPALLYEDVDHAAELIDRVLRDERSQQELGEHLSTRATLFTATGFAEGLRNAVERFLAKNRDEDLAFHEH